MGTLDGFIGGVITELRTITGINFVPDDPVDNVASWPFAPVTAVNGSAHQGPMGLVTFLHNVQVGLLGPRENITQINQILLPKLETIIQELYGKMNAVGFTDIMTFGDIDYIYGPIEWEGIDMFGLVFTIQNVKIENAL